MTKFYFGLEEDQVTLAFKITFTIDLAKIVIQILCSKTHRGIKTVSHVHGKDLLD